MIAKKGRCPIHWYIRDQNESTQASIIHVHGSHRMHGKRISLQSGTMKNEGGTGRTSFSKAASAAADAGETDRQVSCSSPSVAEAAAEAAVRISVMGEGSFDLHHAATVLDRTGVGQSKGGKPRQSVCFCRPPLHVISVYTENGSTTAAAGTVTACRARFDGQALSHAVATQSQASRRVVVVSLLHGSYYSMIRDPVIHWMTAEDTKKY